MAFTWTRIVAAVKARHVRCCLLHGVEFIHPLRHWVGHKNGYIEILEDEAGRLTS